MEGDTEPDRDKASALLCRGTDVEAVPGARPMQLPNVNKLFPRLTIRTKLAIAFTGIAALPLLAVAALTMRITLSHLQMAADRAIEHDLQSTRGDVEQALDYVQRDVEFLAEGVLRDVFSRPPRPAEIDAVERLLAKQAALFRVRAVAADGSVQLSVSEDARSATPPPDEDGLYYALRADSMRPKERLFLPVEVVPPGPSGTAGLPSVAVLVPIRASSADSSGVIVGEAYAAQLFSGLELSDPLVPGVTTLVDGAGLVLYHSRRKPGWDRLLARSREIDEPRSQTLRDRLRRLAGALTRTGHDRFGSTTLSLGTAASAPRLTLYRAVPAAALNGPVLEFLTWVAVTGSLTLLGVLSIAMVAARQFTRPIYLLSRSARDLAAGRPMRPLGIATNDELEDLALDFDRMAATLARHQEALEAEVAERSEALRRTDAELADVVSHAADAIVVVGADERVQLWNQGAEALFGWRAAEVVGNRIDRLLLPPDGSLRAETEFIARELNRQGALVNLQTRRRTRAGTFVLVSLTQSLIRDGRGTAYGQSLVFRDATMQARLESQMRQSERLASVSLMAAGLAHELNNPLAILANRIEIMLAELEDAVDPPRLRQDLGVLQGHVSRLSGLTRDLLRFAREEDDPPTAADLTEIVERSTALIERTLVSRNVRVRREVAPGLPCVRIRVRAIETVLLNLLLNAADAMPKGGTVTVRAVLAEEAGCVEMIVTDQGPGVPPELKGRIFEPFFTTKGPGRGTGLGLTVCRNIVDAHGGRISVENAPSGGASFHVVLPMQGGTAL
ncbi:MAG TPA: ATP-binding protein [Gemmatimonadales bacterium]|nr:ATP-binding protein [Gemmatimonadales bacterium]